jgi:regulatory protein YycH of two-component signal transduction system YycFG
MVQSLILMDDQTMVYQSATPKKYSEFDKMRKKLEAAMGQIAKFMKKKKATQLQLK